MTSKNRSSILIIDDDADLGPLLVEFLEGEGYLVRLATSGKDGLSQAEAEMPHLILLDWQMPQMNGAQVLQALANSAGLANVPIIIMSANIKNITSEFLTGVKTVQKPFDLKELTQSITDSLG